MCNCAVNCDVVLTTGRLKYCVWHAWACVVYKCTYMYVRMNTITYSETSIVVTLCKVAKSTLVQVPMHAGPYL